MVCLYEFDEVTNHMLLSRRTLIKTTFALTILPQVGSAETPREITWDDLIPPGVPYSEIIAEGVLDEQRIALQVQSQTLSQQQSARNEISSNAHLPKVMHVYQRCLDAFDA